MKGVFRQLNCLKSYVLRFIFNEFTLSFKPKGYSLESIRIKYSSLASNTSLHHYRQFLNERLSELCNHKISWPGPQKWSYNRILRLYFLIQDRWLANIVLILVVVMPSYCIQHLSHVIKYITFLVVQALFIGISFEDKVNRLPVTELVNVVLGFNWVLQNTQPPHGMRSALGPISELGIPASVTQVLIWKLFPGPGTCHIFYHDVGEISYISHSEALNLVMWRVRVMQPKTPSPWTRGRSCLQFNVQGNGFMKCQ